MDYENDYLQHLSREEIKMYSEEARSAITKKLECRTCSEICHPPFKYCEKGHFICFMCVRNGDFCVICKRQSVSSKKSYFIQAVYSILELNCKYTPFGCDFIETGKNLVVHHMTCEHYITECQTLVCNWKGRPRDIFDHYREEHKTKFLSDEPDFKYISEFYPMGHMTSTLNVLMRYGRTFLIVIMTSIYRKRIKYIATNLEHFDDIDDFEIIIDMILDDEKRIVNIPLEYSTNTARELGVPWKKLKCKTSLADILWDYTIRIVRKKKPEDGVKKESYETSSVEDDSSDSSD